MRSWARSSPSSVPSRRPRATAFSALCMFRSKRRRPAGRLILIDTPGVHKPDTSLGRKMMAEVREALEGCDLHSADRRRDPPVRVQADQFVYCTWSRNPDTPVFLLLNKIDLLEIRKDKLLPMIDEYQKLHDFQGNHSAVGAQARRAWTVLLEKVINAPAGRAALLSRGSGNRSTRALHGRGDYPRASIGGNQ